MKENEPELKESRLKTEAKYAGATVAIFAIMLTVCASLAKVARVIDPPEDKYRMAIKVVPSKKGGSSSLDVKLIKQCVDQVVQVLPSTAGKTFYKDCE